MFKMPNYPIMFFLKYFEHKKVGHFEFKARDQFSNTKRTEIESLRFWAISNLTAKAIT